MLPPILKHVKPRVATYLFPPYVPSSVIRRLSQPPFREGRGHVVGGASRHTGVGDRSGSGSGNDTGGRSHAHSNSRPLRDLSLRGVRVTSDAAAITSASSSQSSSSSPPSSPLLLSGGKPLPVCCNNSRLGLVAASSQRQGKRSSQEDRTTVAADLVEALAGKVNEFYTWTGISTRWTPPRLFPGVGCPHPL